MSIKIIKGNIFTSKCQTIVNTVNCVGVMGAGIALECRLRYPEMYNLYVTHCKTNVLNPGILWLYKAEDRWILNFPTKTDWKLPSKKQYLQSGLEKFMNSYKEKGIESIAFPLLGADKGGIPRAESQEIILKHLESISIAVEIYHYDPFASDDLFQWFNDWMQSGGDEKLRDKFDVRSDIVSKIKEAMSFEDICQINQLGRVKGIGIKSLEKIFQIARSDTRTDIKTPDIQGSLDL